MGSSIRQQLDGIQRKSLTMGSESLRSDRKSVAVSEGARRLGRVLDRALQLAGITKQQAASDLGYSDQSAISRWISGVENPRFDKLITLAGFGEGMLQALGEEFGRVTVIVERRLA